MNISFKIFVVILAHVFTACSQNRSVDEMQTANIVDIDQQKEEIKATLIDMWDAIEKEDIERYASYIHPDFTQFGETDPLLRMGKQTEIDGMRDWMESSSDIHTEMEEPHITIKGEAAWIVYYWSDAGTTDGKPFASRGKSTRIFVQEESKWLCIHGHYTLLPPNN